MLYDQAVAVTQAAEAYDQAARHRGLAAVPRITALLIANGHSPATVAEIVRLAQGSWAKTATI
jgi:hypothetical protein